MLEKNMSKLEQHYPELYLGLTSCQYPVEDNINLTPVETNGYLNCRIKTQNAELFLHSAYDPSNEAEKWLSTLNQDVNFFVIVGGGLYHHIDYLVSKYPNKKILIIEPSYDILYNAVQRIDLTQYIENKNILFQVSQDTAELMMLLAQVLINKGIEKFELAYLTAYRQLYSSFCIDLERDIFNMIKTLRANIGTEYVHSRKWVHNTFKNLRKTNIDTYPLMSLFNKYEGMPALIVSAGPSLEKQIETLSNNLDKFIIIAAGSAVNALEKHSISPHMVVSVDAEEIQDNIFKNIKDKNITLAYSHSFRYSSLDLFQGKKYWFRGNADNIVDFYEESIGEKTDYIEIGPSCANEAMDIARRLGCNPLIFIGQDLAYTNEALYTKGVVHDLNMATDIGDRILVKDMYGKDITTKTAFLVMKAYFENYVRSHKSVNYINCTEGGLEILGMQHRAFKDVMAELSPLEVDIFKDIESKYKNTQNMFAQRNYRDNNKEFFNHVANEVEGISEKSKERLEKIQALKLSLPTLSIDQAQGKMDEIIDVTNQIENTKLHTSVLHSICAAYYLSVRQSSYSKLEGISDQKEKYKLLLEGIEKQYLYYEVILQSLIEAIKEN
ncbi:motility associated factor glycosyltransferase family protein [Alkaliphilus hydrothermalis]|uniref:6-hydroxymethylpterin diphosphokinase MptE-like domain-containing protein n=1 Tax=Alkaliphilus hydrothermalis TaxID=1482730 RepID=A0ABS2NR02_9FIRM|nr:6-hydroxymethylpterin diphosphokinase MptE-like protein [Alkaliphilus hydrothermalis]MBM7615374.1 hypothetical protein [Alkaliphilus hydrothermalis]